MMKAERIFVAKARRRGDEPSVTWRAWRKDSNGLMEMSRVLWSLTFLWVASLALVRWYLLLFLYTRRMLDDDCLWITTSAPFDFRLDERFILTLKKHFQLLIQMLNRRVHEILLGETLRCEFHEHICYVLIQFFSWLSSDKRNQYFMQSEFIFIQIW